MRRFSALILAVMFAAVSLGSVSAQRGDALAGPLPLPGTGARGENRSTGRIEDGGAFVHITRTTPPDENVTMNHSRLVSEFPGANTSPMTDGNPNAIVFLTFNGHLSTVNQTNPFGVYFSGSNWRIYNEDLNVDFAEGAAFNVQVQGKSDNVFVHTASALNISDHITDIDHPLTNGNPSAIVIVTPRWEGVYNNQHIGVYYNGSGWSIFNQNTSVDMPVGAKFNVQVLFTNETDFVHTTSGGNTSGNVTTLDHPSLNGNSGAQFIVTQHYGAYNNNPIGIIYDAPTERWRVGNTNSVPMPIGTNFNVHITYSGDAFGDGVLINGGFEAPGVDSKAKAIKWNSDLAGVGSKRVCNKYFPKSAATKIVAYTGECAFQLVGVPGELRTLSQNVPVGSHLTGNYMDLRAMLKASGVSGFKVKAKITLDDLSILKFSLPNVDINGTYDWKGVFNGTALPLGKVATNFKVTITLNGSGKVYLDGMSAAVYTVIR